MQENQEKFIELVKEKNTGKKLKYAILTMGCQLNENDSEKIAGMLEKMQYEYIEDYGVKVDVKQIDKDSIVIPKYEGVYTSTYASNVEE